MLNVDKDDLEKDLQDKNGLGELNYQVAKKMKEVELTIYRLTNECEKHHRTMTDIEQEQELLNQRIVRFVLLTCCLSSVARDNDDLV
jgi:hypothetical protein